MATRPVYDDLGPEFVSVREYLSTCYRPDVDYVDGRLEKRNVGEHDRGYLQLLLGTLFTNQRDAWRVRTVTDVRMRTSSTHFRVPDLLVLRADSPKEPVLTHPPLIVIEILSPEDRLGRFQARIDDYIAFGVENIWIFDPDRRVVYKAGRAGLQIVESDEVTIPGTPIRVVPSELFAEWDKA